MRLVWHIEEQDIQRVRNIVDQQRNRRFVARRSARNVSGPLPPIDRDEIWRQLMMCLLTSQQKSGPGSPIFNVLAEKPFRLSAQYLRGEDMKRFVHSTLTSIRGVRFVNNIASRSAANFEKLEAGDWTKLLKWADKLNAQRMQHPDPSHFQPERQAALYMTEYEGFGPKQSRNFWQALGLTRYEFVLDSRMTDWLGKIDFPFPVSSSALGDERYYAFLSDILRQLCLRADVLPCLLDAAVFASYDKQEWPSNHAV